MAFKRCIVASCDNNTITSPKKLFLSVPRNLERRQNWLKAVNFSRKLRMQSNHLFCCEDHFELRKDAENWIWYTHAGTCLKLKPSVVPHRNLERKEGPVEVSQLAEATRQRKDAFLRDLAIKKRKVVTRKGQAKMKKKKTIVVPVVEQYHIPTNNVIKTYYYFNGDESGDNISLEMGGNDVKQEECEEFDPAEEVKAEFFDAIDDEIKNLVKNEFSEYDCDVVSNDFVSDFQMLSPEQKHLIHGLMSEAMAQAKLGLLKPTTCIFTPNKPPEQTNK